MLSFSQYLLFAVVHWRLISTSVKFPPYYLSILFTKHKTLPIYLANNKLHITIIGTHVEVHKKTIQDHSPFPPIKPNPSLQMRLSIIIHQNLFASFDVFNTIKINRIMLIIQKVTGIGLIRMIVERAIP